jgi:hypothetical protein
MGKSEWGMTAEERIDWIKKHPIGKMVLLHPKAKKEDKKSDTETYQDNLSVGQTETENGK